MAGDPWWMHVLLVIHVSAGAFCLVVPLLVLSAPKGGPVHRRWGKRYLMAMSVVAATALAMTLYRPILFLALVAILSFYLAFSGYRVLRLKHLARGGSADAVDWAAAIIAFAGCVCLAIFAVVRPVWIQHMGIVAVVFGAAGIRTAGADLLRFARRQAAPAFWLDAHITKFLGSYIAIWTAFSTTTLSHLFPHAFFAVWLWPGVVGFPVIALTVSYYRRKGLKPLRA